VSLTTSPVTQTADAEVNSASENDVHLPVLADMGRESRNAPINMTARNPIMMIWKEDSFFLIDRLFMFRYYNEPHKKGVKADAGEIKMVLKRGCRTNYLVRSPTKSNFWVLHQKRTVPFYHSRRFAPNTP